MTAPRIAFMHTWLATQTEGWWRYAFDAAGVRALDPLVDGQQRGELVAGPRRHPPPPPSVGRRSF